MNKVKTKKSVSRRFRVTKNGKVLRRVSFGRHLRKTKTAAQKRRFKKAVVVRAVLAKKVKILLGQ
jgi:large subunit ribosomal protein L35